MNYEQVLREVEQLSLEEQQKLLVDLTRKIQQPQKKHRFSEFMGAGRHNPIREDPQAYISRERDEWDG